MDGRPSLLVLVEAPSPRVWLRPRWSQLMTPQPPKWHWVSPGGPTRDGHDFSQHSHWEHAHSFLDFPPGLFDSLHLLWEMAHLWKW